MTMSISQFLVFAIAILAAGTCSPAIKNEEVLHSKLEDALTGNSTYIVQLQKLFLFSTTKKPCYSAEVGIEVGEFNVNMSELDNSPFHKKECCYYIVNDSYVCTELRYWTTESDYYFYFICPDGPDEFQTSNILLGDYIPYLLQSLDPLFYTMIKQLLSAFSIIQEESIRFGDCKYTQSQSQHVDPYNNMADLSLTLFVDELNIVPQYEEIDKAVLRLLSLVKGYARTNGHLEPMGIQYADISTVTSENSNICLDSDSSHVFAIVTAIFFSLNMFVLGLVSRYLHQSLCWIYTQDKQAKNMYVVTVIIVMVVNCSSFIVRCLSQSDSVSLSFVLLTISILLVIEVPIVIYHTITVTRKTTLMQAEKVLFGFLHILGCCHIIWFIHSLGTDAIIATIYFVVFPAQTVGVVTIYLSTILGTIVTLKYAFSTCEWGKLRTCKGCCIQCLSLMCILFTGFFAVALMISVGFLYIILVHFGLSTERAGGYLISFAPPVVALVVGVYIKRERLDKFLKSGDNLKPAKEQDIPVTAIEIDGYIQEELSSTSPLRIHEGKTVKAAHHHDTIPSTRQQATLIARSSSVADSEPLLKESV